MNWVTKIVYIYNYSEIPELQKISLKSFKIFSQISHLATRLHAPPVPILLVVKNPLRLWANNNQ